MSTSPWELCYQAAESNLRNLECAVKDVKTAKELVSYTRNRFNEEAISLINEKTAELERIMSDYEKIVAEERVHFTNLKPEEQIEHIIEHKLLKDKAVNAVFNILWEDKNI